jgi:hypothetical protein
MQRVSGLVAMPRPFAGMSSFPRRRDEERQGIFGRGCFPRHRRRRDDDEYSRHGGLCRPRRNVRPWCILVRTVPAWTASRSPSTATTTWALRRQFPGGGFGRRDPGECAINGSASGRGTHPWRRSL